MDTPATRHLSDARALEWERARRYRDEVKLIRYSLSLTLVDWFALPSDLQLELIQLAAKELGK